jgi:hypothetical protein
MEEAPMSPTQPVPPAAPKRRVHPASVILAIVGVLSILLSGLILAAAAVTVAAPAAATGTSEPTTATKEAARPVKANDAKANDAPTTAKRLPATIVGDGVLLIGEDVKPGRYRATVPADSYICYWARLSSTSGHFRDILANGNGSGGARMTVTIARSDKAFETTGCGVWTKV